MAEQTLQAGAGVFEGGSVLLRRALWLDAIASGGFAVLGLVATEWLSTRFGLPEGVLRGASFAMVPWVVVLGVLATRVTIASTAVRVVIGVNVLWAAASIVLLLSGVVSPTALGTGFVLLQAAGVLLFATLQYAGSRPDR